MSNETPYEPSQRFTNVNSLYSNHFKFRLDDLPDLSFFVTGFNFPSISLEVVERPNPFTVIAEAGDHIRFNAFSVKFRVDAAFKTYFSVFWWMRGVAFPQSYAEIQDFIHARSANISNPRPTFREVMKTTATLSVLYPDSDRVVSEITFQDVFPTGLGELAFQTGDQEELTCMATFNYTDFQVGLTSA